MKMDYLGQHCLEVVRLTRLPRAKTNFTHARRMQLRDAHTLVLVSWCNCGRILRDQVLYSRKYKAVTVAKILSKSVTDRALRINRGAWRNDPSHTYVWNAAACSKFPWLRGSLAKSAPLCFSLCLIFFLGLVSVCLFSWQSVSVKRKQGFLA